MGHGGDYTRANFGGMATGEADFASAARALQSELTDLETKLRSKLAEWDGAAQQAYWTYQREWSQAAQDMQSVVAALGIAIGTANANYQAAERSNSSIWQG